MEHPVYTPQILYASEPLLFKNTTCVSETLSAYESQP
jgi:hypothetical protein